MLTLLIVDQLILIILYSHVPLWRSAEVPSLANLGWSINYVRNMEMVERFHSCPNPNKCQIPSIYFTPFNLHLIWFPSITHSMPSNLHSFLHPSHSWRPCYQMQRLRLSVQNTSENLFPSNLISILFHSIPLYIITFLFHFISIPSLHVHFFSCVSEPWYQSWKLPEALDHLSRHLWYHSYLDNSIIDLILMAEVPDFQPTSAGVSNMKEF